MTTSEWLKKYNIKLKKSLGQNFLTVRSIAEEIVTKSLVTFEDTVIEIGSGIGILTEELAKRAKNVISFEIDERLKPLLIEKLKNYDNIELIFKDFLKADLSQIRDYKKLKYVANIPYYISSPILEKILKESPNFDYAVLMFQKEFGGRMIAQAGKAYSPLSIFVQTYYDVDKIMDVSKTNFVPIPKVDSVVLKLTPNHKNLEELDPDKFMKFIHQCFSNRRKTLKNNLKSIISNPETLLKEIGLNELVRPEVVPIETYIKMYKRLEG
ncbi:MAG TPA: 16S rRNA (adenine(1518)-N(6)/adenine(1519)-N(6))-dimethyltransferase RsmA [Defluviitoga sp.]|nr:16S rRNA (adenine(1518)-N(6)/adenine(1519)-N(6))-dimethyltransferase RsmA [Defluviitoga sp.]HOP24282.1 16S rRNA (adenine(1518)-N(6)/adenine(1519)-N(6))-dimethyltransferase RsmA [Defluviitoga sp.]HPZ28126.1 16S rRNA (adenine(1518)-N(6)/adenine(1519)-N(6))-dimethyltransferase RsmA [Defluviitoga sp.]HQD62016.1 16S rRNA (adenine(1518)-N(6)/adenine(1519)-N(6))-dimethyltransferase RsmA [Defluviitoga sp.]